MKELTEKELKAFRPCADGLEWWIENCAGLSTEEQLLRLLDHRPEWANRVVTRLLSRPGKLSYIIYAAEQVLGIYEKEHPDDTRPRDAIAAANAYVENPTEKNRSRARAAAHAAYAAATATAVATGNAVLVDAATAAAHAAHAAADVFYVAFAAAVALPTAHADAAEVIRHGIEILKQEKEL